MGETVIRIGVLGALDISSPHPLGPVAEDHASQTAEVLAFLAVHPAGVTAEQLSAALWPTRRVSQATRHSAITRARNWLGSATDGQPHLPRTRDGSRYRLHNVTTDWIAFQRLVGGNPTTATTEDLLTAVRLIRGRPFGDPLRGPRRARIGRYTWVLEHEGQMIRTMVAACVELAQRTEVDATTAGAAVDTALELDRTCEAAWRIAINRAWQQRRMEVLDRLASQLRDVLADLGTTPEPQTAELLRRITRDLVAWRLGIDPGTSTLSA